MAQYESKKSEASRKAAPFVSKIVTDPADPPNLLRLTGYRGASSEKDHIRLYANSELSGYLGDSRSGCAS
jgi:hypothetical protein